MFLYYDVITYDQYYMYNIEIIYENLVNGGTDGSFTEFKLQLSWRKK